MSKPNEERNKKIVHLRDDEKMSFREIATFLSLTNSTIGERVVTKIYQREKAKSDTQKASE